jgi:hypothetical protein
MKMTREEFDSRLVSKIANHAEELLRMTSIYNSLASHFGDEIEKEWEREEWVAVVVDLRAALLECLACMPSGCAHANTKALAALERSEKL